MKEGNNKKKKENTCGWKLLGATDVRHCVTRRNSR